MGRILFIFFLPQFRNEDEYNNGDEHDCDCNKSNFVEKVGLLWILKFDLVEVVVGGGSQVDFLRRGERPKGVQLIQLDFLHALTQLLHSLQILLRGVDVHVYLRLDFLLRGAERNPRELFDVLQGIGLFELQLVEGVFELHFCLVEETQFVLEVVPQHLQLSEQFVFYVVEELLFFVEMGQLLEALLGLPNLPNEFHQISYVEVAF